MGYKGPSTMDCPGFTASVPCEGSIYPQNFKECLIWPLVMGCLVCLFLVVWAADKLEGKRHSQGD